VLASTAALAAVAWSESLTYKWVLFSRSISVSAEMVSLATFLKYAMLWSVLTTADTFVALPSTVLARSAPMLGAGFRCDIDFFHKPFGVKNDLSIQERRKGPLTMSIQDPSTREPGYIHLQNDIATESNSVYTTDDYIEIEECAKFFVDNFWLQGTTFENIQLQPEQRKELNREQCRDMSERYGRLVGKRKLESSLLISRDDSGAIEGCVGIEIAVADASSGTVLSRHRCRHFSNFFDSYRTDKASAIEQGGRGSAPPQPPRRPGRSQTRGTAAGAQRRRHSRAPVYSSSPAGLAASASHLRRS
jgi:hypothetical protein